MRISSLILLAAFRVEKTAVSWFLIVKGKLSKPFSVFCICPLELACSKRIPIPPFISGKADPFPK